MKLEMQTKRAAQLNHLFKNRKRAAHLGGILKEENNLDYYSNNQFQI